MFASYSPKDKKNENTLRFTLPGFKSPIYVPFTGRRLAVCERCKKNFKTRDNCRTRDCHVDLPWSDTYVCISLDPSCTDDDGKLVDGPFSARAVIPMAFHYAEKIENSTPICAPCKDKNYTRNYCRLQKRHLQLPWNTVYVILSLKPDNFILCGGDFNMSMPRQPRRRSKNAANLEARDRNCDDSDDDEQHNNVLGKSKRKVDRDEDGHKAKENDDEEDESKIQSKLQLEREGKKMETILPSRTFLTTVSCKGCTIEWLELDPVFQSQYPHLHTFESKQYKREQTDHNTPSGGTTSSFTPNRIFTDDMNRPIGMRNSQSSNIVHLKPPGIHNTINHMMNLNNLQGMMGPRNLRSSDMSIQSMNDILAGQMYQSPHRSDIIGPMSSHEAGTARFNMYNDGNTTRVGYSNHDLHPIQLHGILGLNNIMSRGQLDAFGTSNSYHSQRGIQGHVNMNNNNYIMQAFMNHSHLDMYHHHSQLQQPGMWRSPHGIRQQGQIHDQGTDPMGYDMYYNRSLSNKRRRNHY